MTEIDLLLVDDEPEFRQATAKALGRRGFRVREAAGGAEAVEVVRKAPPQVVLLDLKMEDMNGIETLAAIRGISEEIPVFILTGHGTLDDAMAGLHLGIVDFLQKPVDVAHLAARVRRLLARGHPRSLREPKIAELMVSATAYPRVYDDQPLSEAMRAVQQELLAGARGELLQEPHRSVLVFDRRERFAGCLGPHLLLGACVPPALRGSPYSSYPTGMFLAQSKVAGGELVRDLLGEQAHVDIGAPLLEAVQLLAQERVADLPVTERGELKGMLRQRDLLIEVAVCMLGLGARP